MFREDDGKLSFARIITCATIVFSQLWITYLVIINGKMPDLGGAAGYVGAVSTATYGLNKIAAAITNNK